MLNLGRKERDDDVTTIGAAKHLNIVICTDSQSATPPTGTTDLYIYKGTAALSSTNYITLPSNVPYGKLIRIRSMNGNLYVQSDKGVFTTTGATASTAAVSMGSLQMKSFIYTSIGWVSGN